MQLSDLMQIFFDPKISSQDRSFNGEQVSFQPLESGKLQNYLPGEDQRNTADMWQLYNGTTTSMDNPNRVDGKGIGPLNEVTPTYQSTGLKFWELPPTRRAF